MYLEIIEHCGYEGESWSVFIPVKGNEPFIRKLKETIEKFPDIQYGDSWLEIGEEYNEPMVDVFVKRARSGYFPSDQKIDRIIDPAMINSYSEEDFIDSFYKLCYFINKLY